jgi:SAM-dependent methyltransferase
MRPGQRIERARAAIEAHPDWYHTIDLAPGVSTPGAFDLRGFAPRALPVRLDGLRCLDVGTFDGFWAFELEVRGAAEVVAIDLEHLGQVDLPPNEAARGTLDAERGVVLGEGFRHAAAARGSAVRRVVCNAYDLEPDRIGGPVDFALVGTMLQHTRDPVRVLERVAAVVRPGGTVLLIETVSTRLTLVHPRRPVADYRPTTPGSRWTWWVPNLAALRRMAATVGLEPQRRIPPSYRLAPRHDDRLVAVTCRR